jgi:amidohydrolase
MALQTIVARENDPTLPGVVSVGAFHAGAAPNVIPDTAEIRGTFRSVLPEQRQKIGNRITEIAIGIASAMGGTAAVDLDWGGPPLVNDAAMTAIVKSAAREVVDVDNVIDGPLLSVSDDVAEMLQRVPGCYFFVGSRNRERGLIWGHHHPRFDVDEDALAIGVETMTRTVLRALADGS